MRALVIDAPGEISLREVPAPELPDECLIRIIAAGICGTDLELLRGYADFTGIPGHEFVGIVERAPDRDRHWVGKRVAGEINVGCGQCGWCRNSVKEHCPDRTVMGIRGRPGAFAEYVSLPAANLHEIPKSVDDAAAVFVEPVAAGCRILEQTDVSPDARVAVIGDGRLGLVTAQVLRTMATNVTVFGRHDRKLSIARGIGLQTAATSSDVSDKYDLVVDATGSPEGLTKAIAICEPMGTIILKSTFHGESGAALWPIPVHEITVIGSRCGPFRRAIALLDDAAIDTAALLAAEFPLERHADAFAAARRDLKVLLRPF